MRLLWDRTKPCEAPTLFHARAQLPLLSTIVSRCPVSLNTTFEISVPIFPLNYQHTRLGSHQSKLSRLLRLLPAVQRIKIHPVFRLELKHLIQLRKLVALPGIHGSNYKLQKHRGIKDLKKSKINKIKRVKSQQN